MSTNLKLKLIDLAEETLNELDKINNVEDRKMLIGWMSNFWFNINQDLVGYSQANEALKPVAKKGFLNKLNVGRERIK